jgi:hypothetical protein
MTISLSSFIAVRLNFSFHDFSSRRYISNLDISSCDIEKLNSPAYSARYETRGLVVSLSFITASCDYG